MVNEKDSDNIVGLKGLLAKDLLQEENILVDFVKKTSFGSLEIEYPIKKNTFDIIVEKKITPQNSSVQDILEVQNIYTLNNKIIQTHLGNPDYIIDLTLIKSWHQTLMSGILNNAGEFSKKTRIIPSVEITLTHPDDILEELVYWTEKYNNIKSLSDIAMSHSHFELIHPFSDGNGRIGRSIVLAQSLKAGFIPPIISAQNKEMYYAVLEHSQKHAQYTPLALFFQEASQTTKNDLERRIKPSASVPSL